MLHLKVTRFAQMEIHNPYYIPDYPRGSFLIGAQEEQEHRVREEEVSIFPS